MTIDEVDEEFAAGFAERFAETWRTPDLAKHEALWSDDIVLIQPMMGTLRGKQACRESFQRLFALVPDLHADVHRVGHGKHEVFIEFTLSGTYWRQADRVGRGRPLHVHQWPDRRAGFVLRLHAADRQTGRPPGRVGPACPHRFAAVSTLITRCARRTAPCAPATVASHRTAASRRGRSVSMPSRARPAAAVADPLVRGRRVEEPPRRR